MTRRRGAGARNALGVVLIVLAVLVLGGLGGASLLLRPPPTDPETLCRTDAPLRAHTVVLSTPPTGSKRGTGASCAPSWRKNARAFRNTTASR